MRTNCASIKGAPKRITWAMLGSKRDPRCDIHLASIRRYHREWWLATSPTPPQDVLRPPLLVQAFNDIDRQRACHPDGRCRTDGPIATLFRAAQVVGWDFVNPTTIQTPDGTFDLIKVSPAAMERRYRSDYQRMLDEEASQAILGESTYIDKHGRQPVLHLHAARQLRDKVLRQKKYDLQEICSG